MFKQLKNAVFWYYLYKFRRKIIFIIFLSLIVFFAGNIYDDVSVYLVATKQNSYLKYALLAKWLVIFGASFWIVMIIFSLFKKDKKIGDFKENKVQIQKNDLTKSKKEDFLETKEHLRSKAELLIAKKAKELAKNKE